MENCSFIFNITRNQLPDGTTPSHGHYSVINVEGPDKKITKYFYHEHDPALDAYAGDDGVIRFHDKHEMATIDVTHTQEYAPILCTAQQYHTLYNVYVNNARLNKPGIIDKIRSTLQLVDARGATTLAAMFARHYIRSTQSEMVLQNSHAGAIVRSIASNNYVQNLPFWVSVFRNGFWRTVKAHTRYLCGTVEVGVGELSLTRTGPVDPTRLLL